MIAKLRDESGAIAITVLLLFPSFMLLGVLAVDIGNWYVHKRELQTQADAGALAAAGYYKYPCDDTAIANVARNYAGAVSNRFNGTAEDRIPSASLNFRLNQPNFYNQTTPNDTGMTGSPCADAAVDVKMTETQAPSFFGKSLVPFINAQARVSIRRLEGLKGMLPVALPMPDPRRVRVTFVSEVTGETLGFKDLCVRPAAVNGLNIWDNAAGNPAGWDGSRCDAATAPAAKSLSFNDPAPDPTKGNKWNRVGVIVQLSGATDQIDCGQPLVQCYQSGSSGLGFIHGWSDQPTVTNTANSAPSSRSVVLLPGTCGDAYFNTQTATCTIGVSAGVDFQPREFDGTGNVRKLSGNVDAVSVSALVTTNGTTTTYPLTWNPSTKRWTTSSVSIAPSAGVSTVKLSWEQRDNTVTMGGTNQACTTKNNNPCKATFADVLQRTVSADSTVAGPVKLLQIGNLTSTSGVDDVQECSSTKTTCGDNFVVTVGIGGSLALSQPTDPPSVLRITGGSQTQAIDCDPAYNLKDEIAIGCGPAYGRNTGQSCPDHTQNATQPTGATWFCVWTQTGQSPSQIAGGMNARILGSDKASTCTAPNHWPNYPPNDPRIIPVFLVPFGSFTGSGNASFPVQDFAYFYITGWTGQGGGFANPCQGNGDDPVPGNDAGLIVGHFIKHVDTVNVGGAGNDPCDLTTISGCVAVMTR